MFSRDVEWFKRLRLIFNMNAIGTRCVIVFERQCPGARLVARSRFGHNNTRRKHARVCYPVAEQRQSRRLRTFRLAG